MKRILKLVVYTVVISVLAVVALLLGCNQLVKSNAEGRLYAAVSQVPAHDFGLLLGTTPQTRIGRRQNMFFKYRIDAAEQLYKAGKIRQILISGDADSLDGINEVQCMRDSLVARGVSAQDIILDGQGVRTLNSVVNASEVFGVKSFVVISQKFHNERALYQADHLGLGLHDVVGYNAADATSRMAMLTYVREYFARVKMFLDLLLHPSPYFITNHGRITTLHSTCQ